MYGASGDIVVRLTSMSTSSAGIGQCDLVVVATEAFDVKAAAAASRPLVGAATVVQSVQNGNGSPEMVAAVLGPKRLAVGGVGGFGASVPAPGQAHHNGMEMVRFGSDGPLQKEELDSSAEVWRSSGFTVRLFRDTAQMCGRS